MSGGADQEYRDEDPSHNIISDSMVRESGVKMKRDGSVDKPRPQQSEASSHGQTWTPGTSAMYREAAQFRISSLDPWEQHGPEYEHGAPFDDEYGGEDDGAVAMQFAFEQLQMQHQAGTGSPAGAAPGPLQGLHSQGDSYPQEPAAEYRTAIDLNDLQAGQGLGFGQGNSSEENHFGRLDHIEPGIQRKMPLRASFCDTSRCRFCDPVDPPHPQKSMFFRVAATDPQSSSL